MNAKILGVYYNDIRLSCCFGRATSEFVNAIVSKNELW